VRNIVNKTKAKKKKIEENYKTIFENTGTATIIVEEDTTISLVNGQFEELSGYSKEEIEWKKSWTEFVVEEDLERMKELHYSRRKDPESTLRKYEFRFVNKEGNIRDILIVIDMIPETKKSVASLLDITERKNAEETIKKEIEKSKNYLNIAGVVIVALDTEGNITLLNKKGHKILQYNEGELIGKNWFKTCLPKRYRQETYETFRKLIKGQLELTEFYENPLLTKNGDEKTIAWHNSLLFDSNGNVSGTLSSGEDITEREKAEEKLKDSEEKYRYLFDNAQVGLYWSRISDGTFLECNDTFAKLFGYDKREGFLANYNAIEHYIDPNARSELLKEIRDNKEDKNYEIHVTKRDGTPIWLSISARMLEKENRIEGAAIDITERKKAEQKLKENTEFTQNVFSAIQDGLSVLDLDLNIVNVNLFMIEKYGPIDQIENRKCYDVYQKRSSPCPWCPSIKTIETGQLNTSIVPYPTSEDPTGWIELTAFPLKNSDGIVEGIIEYVKDITDRKKAEEKLQLERDNFLNILNSMQDGVYIVDQNYDIEYVNPILTKEYGHFEGIKCFKYFHDLSEPCPWCKNNEVFQEKTVRWEWFSFKNQKTYDLIDTPLKNPDGSISKLEIFRDISEIKKVEQELKESEEKHREAYNRAEFYKDIFAHDINNILQSILSGMEVNELILNNPDQLENLEINARIIKEQVIRGAELVSNVRKLSQLEETKQNLKKIEIFNLLENVISLVKKSNKDKKLTFRIDSVDGNLFVKANYFLEDMFENLLINAIKHNRNLIIAITVRISREEKNSINYIKMEFLDNGIGVDDTMKNRIFKRGYNEDKSVLGMGLGLSLVRRIIETYNGKIWVEDRVEGDRSKGSNFVILIPEVV